MTPGSVLRLERPPESWQRLGLAMDRGSAGEFDSSVTGDPCIVWDDARGCYHMFYFAQKHIQGEEVNSNGHAVAQFSDSAGLGAWTKLGPLDYTNASALCGDTHKPWVLMDPYRSNVAAVIDGMYWLFTVSFRGSTKVIQLATSESLDGPWRVRREPVIDVGCEDAFDGYHADTITAYWFEKQGEIVLYYKGYPRLPQQNQPHSPYGGCNAVAVMSPSDTVARKVAKTLSPSPNPEHWTAGFVGGLQIFPAVQGGWYGILNASPTPPVPVEQEPDMREPAPSLGGWAYTAEEWPVRGWRVADQPIEWIEDIPEEAQNVGEGVNLWRHHILILPNGEMYLFYNTGAYGQERLFVRHVPASQSPARWTEQRSSKDGSDG